MTWSAFRWTLLVGALSTAGRGMAEVPMPVKGPPTVWDLEWQDSFCTITTGDKRTLGLSFWMTPGDPSPEIYLIGSPSLLPHDVGDKVTLTLSPGGLSRRADAGAFPSTDPVILRLYRLGYKFPAAFSNSDEVEFDLAGKSLAISVHGADKAMAALQGCVDDALSKWGVDAKAFAALRKPPSDIDGYDLLTANDYPQLAIDRNETGRVVARLHVDATGRVQDCTVVVSSRSTTLDSTTCRLALKRGKFDPAIGPDGKPVAAPRIISVKYALIS